LDNAVWIAAAEPVQEAFWASLLKFTNLGTATAANMPMMTMTMINSINVKPFLLNIKHLLDLLIPRPLPQDK
jgi:hypothetical protein